MKQATEEPKSKRQHKATYARDKRKGGYLIRISGPHAGAFAGREVPVSTMAGEEHNEKIIALIWQGVDAKTGEPVALYTFESKPREKVEEFEF